MGFVSETEIPGLRTDSLGTLGTVTNIAETVSGQTSLGQPNLKLWEKLPIPVLERLNFLIKRKNKNKSQRPESNVCEIFKVVDCRMFK